MNKVNNNYSLSEYAERALQVREIEQEIARAEKGQPVDISKTAEKLHRLSGALNQAAGTKMTTDVQKAYLAQKQAVNSLTGRANALSPKNAFNLPSWVKPAAYTALGVVGIAAAAFAAQKFMIPPVATNATGAGSSHYPINPNNSGKGGTPNPFDPTKIATTITPNYNDSSTTITAYNQIQKGTYESAKNPARITLSAQSENQSVVIGNGPTITKLSDSIASNQTSTYWGIPDIQASLIWGTAVSLAAYFVYKQELKNPFHQIKLDTWLAFRKICRAAGNHIHFFNEIYLLTDAYFCPVQRSPS